MQQQSTKRIIHSFFNDFGSESQQQQQKPTKSSADVDWFGDFGKSEPKK